MVYRVEKVKSPSEEALVICSRYFNTDIKSVRNILSHFFKNMFAVYEGKKLIAVVPYYELNGNAINKIDIKKRVYDISHLFILEETKGLNLMKLLSCINNSYEFKGNIVLHLSFKEDNYGALTTWKAPYINLDSFNDAEFLRSKKWIRKILSRSKGKFNFAFKKYNHRKDREIMREFYDLLDKKYDYYSIPDVFDKHLRIYSIFEKNIYYTKLSCGKDLVSASLLFNFGDVISREASVFNDAYKRFRPGSLLIFKTICEAKRTGLFKKFSFGPILDQENIYKLRWCKDFERTQLFYLKSKS